MADPALRVRGLRDLQKALAKAERETRGIIRDRLRRVGEPLRAQWAQTFSRIDTRSASKLRVRVRQRGIAVEQSLRKTTGLRGDYGAMQMRHGIAALSDREDQIMDEMNEAVEDIADILRR